MLTDILQSVKSIIAGEMPCWFRFCEPAAIPGKNDVHYCIAYEQYDAPLGNRQRRVRITISKRLLEKLSDLDDTVSQSQGLDALRREISRNFEKLAHSERLAEWFIDEFSLGNCF